jgi:hypothetical protein
MKEKDLYKKFADKIKKKYPKAWVYKIPDTKGLGGKRPFDTIAVIKGVPFALEFKSKGKDATKYQDYQLTRFSIAGGISFVFQHDGPITMDYLIKRIGEEIKERR